LSQHTLTRIFAGLGLALALSSAGLARKQPPLLPDPRLTPGDTLPVTRQDVCVPGYSKKIRDVPDSVKNQAYAAYGITSHKPHEYEVDHLISLELGGSNSIKNLWPQSYITQPWNAHVKDTLENELHRQVCSGKMDMKAAQDAIAKDWIACYKQTFHTDHPLAKGQKAVGSRQKAEGRRQKHVLSAANGAGGSKGDAGKNSLSNESKMVWVNTRSGKYFLPGSKYYGKTKEGKYMSEAEARKQGFTAAK
jgi:hypothetical protein